MALLAVEVGRSPDAGQELPDRSLAAEREWLGGEGRTRSHAQAAGQAVRTESPHRRPGHQPGTGPAC